MLGLNYLGALVMDSAWTFARGFGDGMTRGKWKVGDEQKSINPAHKLARRLRADAQQMFTGYHYDPKTMKRINTQDGFFKRNIGNRLTGGLHLVSNMTLGTLGTGLGWATRGMSKAAYGVSKPMFKGAAYIAYGGAEVIGETALDATKLLIGKKNPVGKHIMFGAAATGAIGVGVGEALSKDILSGASEPMPGMAFYQGRTIESLPGTLASQGYGSSSMMVDTGADGDLVLALHNLR